MAVAVIKTRCPEEFKKKFSEFVSKKGETESAIVRKAIIQMMASDPKKG